MSADIVDNVDQPQTLPLLPLRDIVVFPGMTVPLFVGRPRSVKALNYVFERDRRIMLAAQKDPSVNEPEPSGIYQTGCITEVLQILRLPDGTIKALVEGVERARIDEYLDSDEFFTVSVTSAASVGEIDTNVMALARTAQSLFEKYIKLNPNLSLDSVSAISGLENPGAYADAMAANVLSGTVEKQKLLETVDLKSRLEILINKVQEELEVLQIEKQVRGRVKKQMEKSQRDYYLTEQMKAIQKELGRSDGEKTEFEELAEKIRTAGMPKEVEKKALKELGRLEQMPPMSAEGTVVRGYLDWLLDVPWKKRTRDKLDIPEASRILDEDHYGLEKIKERILEHLSVKKLVKKMKGPILCFVGPPGVGKTSLGRSIARATGRKFVRFSLGGIRDEAEIRGHRRTYIGAMPGRIIQAMKRAGVKNPVIMLDEIDKVSSDFRGDPSSALLEALDPEQNTSFNDHYLEVDYDLSETMFITTANVLHTIPRPLQDRMEIITIPGYTDEEKEQIARRFLFPKQVKEHGLPDKSLILRDAALARIIRNYTRESGVRNLDRRLAGVCRKIARKVAEKSGTGKRSKTSRTPRTTVDEAALVELLGEIEYRDDTAERKNEVGVSAGLAWTETGGALLKVETIILEGKNKFILTGKLGDVMKESAQAALSYIRSRARDFGLVHGFHNKIDIHIHIPEGAIPKDGPSAGITLATSMVSALLHIPVRRNIAMTGEITLRGNVLPVGGLKEKLLAAHRAGMDVALIPKENERDLSEIPDKIKKEIKVVPVGHMDEVLKLALTKTPYKKRPPTRSSKRTGPVDNRPSALN